MPPRAAALPLAALALAAVAGIVVAQQPGAPGTVTLLASSGDVVLDKSPVFSDELTEPRYVVEIVSSDDASSAPSSPAPSTKTLTLTDSAGRAFACATRHEDWWTYEFCYGRHVRQYHADGDGVVVDAYLLGVGNGTAAASVDDVVRHDPAAPPAQAAYVAAHYGDGAPCELTGGARATEVRFVCPEGGGGAVGGGSVAAVATPAGATAPPASLLSAREPATCAYAVTVGVPALCGHPGFRPVDPPTRTIVCRPRDGGAGGRQEA